MPDYVDGKQGKQESFQHITVSESKPQPQQELDVDALASAVAKALGTLPTQRIVAGTGGEIVDTFSDERSLESIAKAMLVQRGNKDSNFEDLGKVQETKKDVKDTDAVIDLLKGLD